MTLPVRNRYDFFFEVLTVRLPDLTVRGNHGLRVLQYRFLNSCSQIMRNRFRERYRRLHLNELLASWLLLLLTYWIILGCKLFFLLIKLLNILFRQLNTTASDASDRFFRNGNICLIIIDGSRALLFVFGSDLLLLMRFD